MRFLSLLLFSFLFGAGSVSAGESAKSLVAHLKVTASVDSNGTVTALEFADDALHAAIREPLERAMRGWEFEPAQIDGLAAPSRTHLSVTVVAEPVAADGEAYALRVTRASNGPRIVQSTPPRYPREAIRSLSSARVVLEVEFDATGRVTEASLDSVEKRRGKDRGVDALVEAAIASVREWTFLPEQVAGQAIPASVKVPIGFCIGPVRARGTCFDQDELDSGTAPADGEQRLIAEHPVARLKTEVVGRLL